MEPTYFFPLNPKSRDQITHLFFKNLQLNSIQNSFANFQNLIYLDLSRNNLLHLPIQISNIIFLSKFFSGFEAYSFLLFFSLGNK